MSFILCFGKLGRQCNTHPHSSSSLHLLSRKFTAFFCCCFDILYCVNVVKRNASIIRPESLQRLQIHLSLVGPQATLFWRDGMEEWKPVSSPLPTLSLSLSLPHRSSTVRFCPRLFSLAAVHVIPEPKNRFVTWAAVSPLKASG